MSRRGSAGIYRRGGYAYAREGAAAVARAILDAAHDEALELEAATLDDVRDDLDRAEEAKRRKAEEP